MGWPTRGTGRSYDSLSGFAVLIGYFSKKILDYVGLNRKCNKCDKGHPADYPGCRKHFIGSAKAMEPRAAAIFASESSILKECGLQWAIPICDNDSGIVASMRDAVDYKIVKHADKNHTSNSLSKQSYKTKAANQKDANYKELNSETIKYLKKCFNYAISQNVNDSEGLAKNLRCIPKHCFDDHTDCSASWCGYLKNPETYQHANIGKGLENPVLLRTLTAIFDKFADNAPQFAAGVSSNGNESLNNFMAAKAPKSRLYGKSESGAFRQGLVVLRSNEGEHFTTDVNLYTKVSPGSFTIKRNERQEKYSKIRYEKSKTIEFKKNVYLINRKSIN